MFPKINSEAPKFSLPDQNGAQHSLEDYSGQWVLLYFYPKDDTPGCTTEACGLRDSYADYKKNKIVVLGVSKDTVKSHAKFVNKFSLPFTLLADENLEVNKAYGAWAKKKFLGREYMGTQRVSFLIDPQGKIKKIYEKVKPAEHSQEVLNDYKNLQ